MKLSRMIVATFICSAMLLSLLLISPIDAPVAMANNGNTNSDNKVHYEPTWESLAQKDAAPEWYENAVLGIYYHWGINSVATIQGAPNPGWYGKYMYKEGSSSYSHHLARYGDPCEFGYKDLIPMWNAENWDPDRWAELFENAGADFAGSIAEHHDGFALWDTEYDNFNSMDMGPKRDIVGEMLQAVREHGMRTITTFHNGCDQAWAWYDFGRELCPEGVGVNNPKYYGLYGEPHEPGAPLFESFKEEWLNKTKEVIRKYQPDLIWLETHLKVMGDYRQLFLAHYFNAAENMGKEVVVTHKGGDLPRSCSPLCIERGKLKEPRLWKWVTGIPIDYWYYTRESENRMPSQIEGKVNNIVDEIVDRTSKNGSTLLDVGPRPDGTIVESQVEILNKLGDWMDVNKKALYASEPAPFVEGGVDTCEAGTIRFIRKGNYLYAIELRQPWVGEVIPGVTPVPGSEIKMLGSSKSLDWHQDGDDVVMEELPDPLPCDYAWAYEIQVVSDTTPPTPFNLLSPTNDATISDNTPTLEWEASSDNGSGLDHYEVWLDGSNVDNVLSSSTSFTSPTLSRGSHSWYVIAVDGLGNKRESESFAFEIVSEVEQAEFELSSLSVSKGDVEPGESTTVSVMVKNTGGEGGTHTVELSIDGETKTKEVTLDPGTSETVSFDVSENGEGIYEVSVGDLTGSFEVSAPKQPEGGGFPVVPVAGVVAIVVAAIGILAYRRKR